MKLLNHFDIHTPMTSYHEYNKYEKGRKLVEKMQAGSTVALITDAGTPGISDPGEELVRMCHEAGIPVTAVPGAAACITGLVISGLPTGRFAFEAFLPADKKEREAVLETLRHEQRTMVIYEAPHRLVKTSEAAGPDYWGRTGSVSVCRELTKKHETVFRSTLGHSASYYESAEPKGECVIIIEGLSREQMEQEAREKWEDMSIEDHVAHYMSQGEDRKEAMKKAAKDRGVSKRDIYNYLEQNKEK